MLTELLVDAYHRRPATLAVADAHQTLTYKQLTLLASVLRTMFLRETGCPRVGLMLPASSIFPAALFGALWSGKTVVPLNFLLHAEELARVVEDAGLDLVLTIRHFDELSAQLPARSVFLEDLPLRRRMALAMLRRLPPRPIVDPNATAVLLYTSGTTAGPKGVELTHDNLYTNCIDTIDSLVHDIKMLEHKVQSCGGLVTRNLFVGELAADVRGFLTDFSHEIGHLV